ncbi:hypothetical protein NZ698_02900 [Chryseobacterium sp. PBS4-4]|uniref:Copper-binding protein MbnP-like domain-containing protein n=1 Tax=Chryseobacterium edaphi TaxID=2976532 RepID=A0ABT2W1P7_9FLAO|nr:MbnP family protein [Chryseobacterium edaphi]MCU7616136.1 hypothetical protein [Chryseobacterium edaphi]
MRTGIYFLLSFYLGLMISHAQNLAPLNLEVRAVYNKNPIVIKEDRSMILDDKTGLEISKLKFYLSHFELYNDNEMVFSEENSYHLMDASDENSMKIQLSIPENIQYNKMKFYLGIDRKTNEEGIKGGSLDPTKGMYWSWQSGYINFKMEGKSNLCKTRYNEFTFHLGGFSDPFYAMQEVEVNINSHTKALYMDIDQFFSKINLSEQNNIMIPGKKSVEMSKIISKIFRAE